MAEATGTELAMSNASADPYSGGSEAEQKSGFMDSLGSTDMVRQQNGDIRILVFQATQ